MRSTDTSVTGSDGAERPAFLPLARALMSAGALPFVVCAVWIWLGGRFALGDGSPTPVGAAIGYGAVIASFVAGIHWAIHLFAGERCGVNLLLASNVVALAAWSALLIGGATGLAILIACFLALFALDRRLFARGVLPAWFFRLRRAITAIVTLALVATLAGALRAG